MNIDMVQLGGAIHDDILTRRGFGGCVGVVRKGEVNESTNLLGQLG